MNSMIRPCFAIALAFLILPGMATAKAQLPARPATGLTPAVVPDPTSPSQPAEPSVAATPAAPAPAPAAPRKSSYNSCNVDGTCLAITFDDGPHPKNTPRLLDMLKARGLKATFYVIGQNVAQYPEVMQRIVAEGHEIGNHSYTHVALNKCSAAKVNDEVSKTNEAILQSCGAKPTTIRPPYGATNAALTKRLNDEFGLTVVMWSVDPLDWKIRNSSHVSGHILQNAKSGSIILSHDIHPTTIDAMPQVLDGLMAKGHKFVTVSELIAMDRPAGASTPSGPGVPANPDPVSYEPAAAPAQTP
jgi:peptidoglycan/xylan/chitin deacetylase (PgdA/CDA1 family)